MIRSPLTPLTAVGLAAVLASLALKSSIPLVMGAALLFTDLLSHYWSRASLREVGFVRRLDPPRVFAGETTTLELEVSNGKSLPLPRLDMEDLFPRAVRADGLRLESHPALQRATVHTTWTLGGRERVRRRVTLSCPRRGTFVFGPARITGGDPLGLRRPRVEADRRDVLIVYPKVHPLPRIGLERLQSLGGPAARGWINPDPSHFSGIREYRAGDPVRRVHWKASARTGRLQVKTFDPAHRARVALLVNVRTFRHTWDGIDSPLVEDVLSAAASMANDLDERGVPFSLVVNAASAGAGRGARGPGRRQPSAVPPVSPPAYALSHALELLAAVNPGGTVAFSALTRAASVMPPGLDAVIITGVWDEDVDRVMAALHFEGVRTHLVHVTDDGPSPAGAAGPSGYYRVPRGLSVPYEVDSTGAVMA